MDNDLMNAKLRGLRMYAERYTTNMYQLEKGIDCYYSQEVMAAINYVLCEAFGWYSISIYDGDGDGDEEYEWTVSCSISEDEVELYKYNEDKEEVTFICCTK